MAYVQSGNLQRRPQTGQTFDDSNIGGDIVAALTNTAELARLGSGAGPATVANDAEANTIQCPKMNMRWPRAFF